MQRRYAELANVGKGERWVSLALGSWLMLRSLNPRNRAGLFSAAAGMELLRRGLTGRCRIYRALNIDRANQPRLFEDTEGPERVAAIAASRKN